MAEPREYQTEAVVIKKTKLGEADSILTLFTPGLGKIQGFGKSLRKTNSKMAGHLELLTHSTVTFARGRNIDTIIGAQTIHSFLPIKDDLWLTSCGLYLAELVNQFTVEHQENEPLFNLLVATLSRLSKGADPSLALRYFELHLLEETGFRPQLRECVVCHRPLEPETNYFNAPAGGLLCCTCRAAQPYSQPLTLNAQKVLRFLQANSYEQATRVRLDAGITRELESLIGSYFRYLLERDIKAAAWLDNLREQMAHLKAPERPPQASAEQTPGPD